MIFFLCFNTLGLVAQQSFPEFQTAFLGQGVYTLSQPGQDSVFWKHPEPTSPQWLVQTLGLRFEGRGVWGALEWSFMAEGRGNWDGQNLSMNPGPTWLEINWERTLFAQGGWLTFSPNFGRLLALENSPLSLDPTRFLSWGGDAPRVTALGFQLRWAGENWSARSTLIPFPTNEWAPHPQGVWFPRSGIPETYYFDPLQRDFYLKKWAYLSEETSPLPLRVYTEWKSTLGNLEISADHFWGQDPQSNYNPKMTLLFGASDALGEPFVLDLKPERGLIHRITGGLSGFWEDWEFWAAGALTLGRIRVGSLTASGAELPLGSFFTTRTHPEAEANGGMAWKFFPGFQMWIEGRWWWDLYDSNTPIPDQIRSMSSGLLADFFDGKLQAQALVLAESSFNSGIFMVKLAWEWQEGITLWGQIPWFWGTTDSFWGQYNPRIWGQLGWSWVF